MSRALGRPIEPTIVVALISGTVIDRTLLDLAIVGVALFNGLVVAFEAAVGT